MDLSERQQTKEERRNKVRAFGKKLTRWMIYLMAVGALLMLLSMCGVAFLAAS